MAATEAQREAYKQVVTDILNNVRAVKGDAYADILATSFNLINCVVAVHDTCGTSQGVTSYMAVSVAEACSQLVRCAYPKADTSEWLKIGAEMRNTIRIIMDQQDKLNT